MKDGLHNALVAFVDFIYAVVFTILVQQTFDRVINEASLSWSEKALRLLIVVAVFYFLAWDWIVGRILTLRHPYESYSRFFFEVLIAAFAYGTANAAVEGKVSLLVCFAFLLLAGMFWAMRTERQVERTDQWEVHSKRDAQELCMIQSLHFSGAVVALIFYCWWESQVNSKATWTFGVIIVFALWCFVFAYELMVPRQKGIIAGPGVPFVGRSNLRKLRRLIFELID